MASFIQGLYRHDELQLFRSGWGTVATNIDLLVSEDIVTFMGMMGRAVVSEERDGTTYYGAKDAEYADPVDGTNDLINAWINRRPSFAAFSLGSVEGGRIVRGAVSFPLLKVPRLYWAENGKAYYQPQWYGPDTRCHVAKAERGIVLASENDHPYKDKLTEMGFEVVSLGGIVFKAACVADPRLLGQYSPKFADGPPVVGCVSSSAQAHDYVGVASIVTGAGGFTGPLPLTEGKHGCVFANSIQNRSLMLEALRTS